VIAAGLALRVGLSLAGVSELSISVLTPCRVDTLCVGALLAALMRREGFAPVLVARAPRLLALAGAAIVAVSLWCVLARTGLLALHQLRSSLYAILFGGLCLASLRGTGVLARVFRSAPLRLFGKYSYGLYVYHGFLTWYFHEFGAEARFDALFAGHHGTAMVAKAIFGIALSLAVAAASYELVEKRFLLLKRWFEPGAAPAAALAR
jgi:peptidoglycan/LPS O-acetylase OafA/YrhL